MPKIPGFRPGKVPESVVRRKFATEIRKEVIDGLLPERFNNGVRELGIKPVGQPQVTEITVEDGKPLHMKAVFEYIPAFSIDGYQDVKVEKPSEEVTEDEFQHELTELRDSRATIEPVEEDRPMVDGDWAQISYTGKVEGEPRRRAHRRSGRAGRDWRQRHGGSLQRSPARRQAGPGAESGSHLSRRLP
jgi:trigger factor